MFISDIDEEFRDKAVAEAEKKLMKAIIRRIRRLANKRNPNKRNGVGLHLDIHSYSDEIIEDLKKLQ